MYKPLAKLRYLYQLWHRYITIVPRWKLLGLICPPDMTKTRRIKPSILYVTKLTVPVKGLLLLTWTRSKSLLVFSSSVFLVLRLAVEVTSVCLVVLLLTLSVRVTGRFPPPYLADCDLKRVSGREFIACGEGETPSCMCSSRSCADVASGLGFPCHVLVARHVVVVDT